MQHTELFHLVLPIDESDEFESLGNVRAPRGIIRASNGQYVTSFNPGTAEGNGAAAQSWSIDGTEIMNVDWPSTVPASPWRAFRR